jgi:hypothetical protein
VKQGSRLVRLVWVAVADLLEAAELVGAAQVPLAQPAAAEDLVVLVSVVVYRRELVKQAFVDPFLLPIFDFSFYT